MAWTLSEREGRLSDGANVKVLTPRAAAVLAALVRRRGEAVSREEIIAEAWRGVHVAPDIVRVYIHDLRETLGDDAGAPRYIETVRGRGFRLIGEVAVGANMREGSDSPVIAVLRPDYFAPHDKWRYLADSLAEDLTTDLARFADLTVIARHSAFSVDRDQGTPAIARALNADYLVESSLAVIGDRVRATFQLIEATSGRHVWAERREHPLDALLSISEETAISVANAIGGWRGMVQDAERRRALCRPSESWNAYEHYLMCLHNEHVFDQEGTERGIEHGERAVALDPNHARAWLLLYFLYMRRVEWHGTDPAGSHRLATAAIRRAYTLDPREAKIICEMGTLYAAEDNLAEAAVLFHRAEDLGANQGDVLSLLANAFCLTLGEFTHAQALLDRAFRLNPFPPLWYGFAQARVAYFSGDYERCWTVARSVEHVLAGALYGALAAAMMGADDADARARHLADHFAHFDPHAHAAMFPIKAPAALERYFDGIAKLNPAPGGGVTAAPRR